jgi:hypothetical protein
MSKGGVPGSGTVSQTKDDEGTPPACSDSTQSKTNATDKDGDEFVAQAAYFGQSLVEGLNFPPFPVTRLVCIEQFPLIFASARRLEERDPGFDDFAICIDALARIGKDRQPRTVVSPDHI